ncbi:MAG: glycosyltransferase family A protein [Pseudomonadota bacterium]
MNEQKKYKVGFIIQSFCIDDRNAALKFPEMQIFRMITESDFYKLGKYDIYLVTNNGKVLSPDLKELGFSNNFNLDFIVYTHDAVNIDGYRIASSYVMPDFLVYDDFLILCNAQSQSCTIADLIDNYQHKNTCYVAPTYKSDLLSSKEKIIFYNFGASTILEPISYEDKDKIKLSYISMSDPLIRHGELIHLLDQKGYCAFYGPKSKWRTCKNSYVSSPEYGEDVGKILNKHGVCLAMHSPIHHLFDLHTTRIPEGCMAGCIIITDDYSYIKEIFGDSVFTLDFTRSAEDCLKDITNIMRWIRNNPQDANKMALKSQQIFKERYLQKDWILELCYSVEKAKEEYIKKLNDVEKERVIDVIYSHQDSNVNVINRILDQLLNQYYRNINFIVVCKDSLVDELRNEIKHKLKGAPIQYQVIGSGCEERKVNKNNTGSMFLKASKELKGEFFTFIDVNTLWNKDHLSRLVYEIQNEKYDFQCAYSGQSLEYNNLRTGINRHEEYVCPEVPVHLPIRVADVLYFCCSYSFIDAPYYIGLSAFERLVELRFMKGVQIFRKNVLNLLDDNYRNGIGLIDGCEHIFLLVMMLLEGKTDNIYFTQYVSSALNIMDIPKISPITNNIRYSLYPNAPLVDQWYRRTVGCMAAQLYKVLANRPELSILYSKYGSESQNIQFQWNDKIINVAEDNSQQPSTLSQHNLVKVDKISKKYNNNKALNRFIKISLNIFAIYCKIRKVFMKN